MISTLLVFGLDGVLFLPLLMLPITFILLLAYCIVGIIKPNLVKWGKE